MRRGHANQWSYDRSPVEKCSVCGEYKLCAIIDNRAYCADDTPDYWEREYNRQFPSNVELHDNAAALARFRRLAGIAHKESKEVTRVVGMTRREETYARLAEKVKGNKWFDENAS